MSSSSKDRKAPELSVGAFQELVDAFTQIVTPHTERERQIEHRIEIVRGMIERHRGDKKWHDILHRACEAARGGHREVLVLRFPSSDCTDGGRAINVQDAAWPDTLQGHAADIYLEWQQTLADKGFRLAARILAFPRGSLGDAGLFLSWA